MTRGHLAAVLLGLAGILALPGMTSGAVSEPSISIHPSHGACSDDLAVMGSGFAPGSDLVITGIFDLIETTALGTATAGGDGGFSFPIPPEGMPERCSQGTKLLVAADPAGEAPGVSRVTAFFLVDGPWEIELDPAVTDCTAPVEVRGAGFGAEQRMFLAWGEVDQFVEAHFFEIGAAQTDSAGEFETSIDVTRRCNRDGEWGIYAWPVDERGRRFEEGWAEAVLGVRSAAAVTATESLASRTPTVTSAASPLPIAATTTGGDEESGDSSAEPSPLFLAAIVITVLAALAVTPLSRSFRSR